MNFTLGFSPCPNDTFIFDALVNRKIDTQGFEFDTLLEDVQTLNQWALQGKLEFFENQLWRAAIAYRKLFIA
jgi:1,4-dihydroxy-6-naphthoate synthase